ncbi:hypothetical protein AB0C34_17480 [Nocardia sp. NPDC049220]|uniref:hypothetical protein n=1 Tax=Nocardia sp. NPDC049220 TaxID=3155273 RepID=UPI0033D72F9B
MTFPNVLLVSEFRAKAPSLIKEVAERRGRRVFVGANRRPEAVLMSVTADVPPAVRQALLDTFFSYAVEDTFRLDMWRDGTLTHVGDGFGGVFAWLWRVDQTEAMEHFARYARLLRDHDKAPKVLSLEEILVALQFAADLTDDEYSAIRDRAHAELAGRFHDDNQEQDR